MNSLLSKKKKSLSLIKPPPLKAGDVVALVRPGSRLDSLRFERTAAELRKLGFFVVTYRGRWNKDAYFAASDQDRASEMQWAMSEPAIKAVLAARGGYGSQRLIESLSVRQIERWSPKIFVGYSDLTYFHQWLQNQLGWLSFHGPLVGFMERPALSVLMKNLTKLSSNPWMENWSELKSLNSQSIATGKLVGGNLALLRVAGPAALPRNEDLILAIEDVNEPYYKLDRMLRSLLDAGYSENVKGILLGSFLKCGIPDRKTFGWNRILESLRALTSGPILSGGRFGHGLKSQRLLPLGISIKIKGKTLVFQEGCVSAP